MKRKNPVADENHNPQQGTVTKKLKPAVCNTVKPDDNLPPTNITEDLIEELSEDEEVLFTLGDTPQKTFVDTNNLTNTELIAELKKRNLDHKGTKMQKLLRLEQFLKASQPIKEDPYHVTKKRQENMAITKPSWFKKSVSPFDPRARQSLPPAWR